MAHPSFRGCEKRVLQALITLESCTKYDLRTHLTRGIRPISETGVNRGLQTCLHNKYVSEHSGKIEITEKGKAFFEEQNKKRKASDALPNP